MRPILAAIFSLVTLAACATRPMPQPGQEGGLDRAVGQPFRDLSLIREVAPDALQRAAAAPYDKASLTDCAAAQAAVAELDAALGPDLAPDAKTAGFTAQGLAGDLIGGAIGLPFRGVVRKVSGAEARELALRAAVVAGMVRRGFIKGRMDVTGCPLPPAPPAAQPAKPAAAAPPRQVAVIPPSTR